MGSERMGGGGGDLLTWLPVIREHTGPIPAALTFDEHAGPGAGAFAFAPLAQPKEMPGVPATFRTRLRLELAIGAPSVDLNLLVAIILDDFGATLEILRCAGRNWAPGDDRPERIEDALADLSLGSILEAVSASGPELDAHPASLTRKRTHARLIADEMSRLSQDESTIPPHEAYLVGLLHEIGMLPSLFGWLPRSQCAGTLSPGDKTLRPTHKTSALAEAWRLPWFLITAFREIEAGSGATPWAAMLERAHAAERLRLGLSEEEIRLPDTPPRARVLPFVSSHARALGRKDLGSSSQMF